MERVVIILIYFFNLDTLGSFGVDMRETISFGRIAFGKPRNVSNIFEVD